MRENPVHAQWNISWYATYKSYLRKGISLLMNFFTKATKWHFRSHMQHPLFYKGQIYIHIQYYFVTIWFIYIYTKAIVSVYKKIELWSCMSTFCLFVWGFSSHLRIFIHIEGVQIFTYALHMWPLNSEGSLACIIYCDPGHPFKMVIFEDPWHSHLLSSVWQWSYHHLFKRLRSVSAWIRTANLPLTGRTI